MNTRNDRFNRGRQMDDIPSGGREDTPRMEDLVLMAQFPTDKYASVRVLPDVFTYGGHWVQTKKRDGSKGAFYAGCSAFDPETGQRTNSNGAGACPWCTYEAEQRELGAGKNGVPESKSSFRPYHYLNVIMRSIQRAGDNTGVGPTAEEAETGFKDIDSEAWTPVRTLKAGPGLIKALREVRELNLHETRDGTVAFPVADMKYGCDVLIKHNPKASSPQDVWKASKGDHKPITKDEREYLIWDLKDRVPPTSLETAEREYASWAQRNGVSGGDGGETRQARGGRQQQREEYADDDLPPAAPARNRAPAPAPQRGRAAPPQEEEGFDDGGEEGFGEDDAPPPPPRGRAPAAPQRGRAAPPPQEEEGFDDGGEDGFGEEEAPPPPPRRPAAAPARTQAPQRGRAAPPPAEEPEEFGEEGDGFGEEEAPPPPPRRTAAPAQQRRAPPPPADDDGFAEDDGFDAPPPPPRRAPARR